MIFDKPHMSLIHAKSKLGLSNFIQNTRIPKLYQGYRRRANVH
jgi:hypothetical protein